MSGLAFLISNKFSERGFSGETWAVARPPAQVNLTCVHYSHACDDDNYGKD